MIKYNLFIFYLVIAAKVTVREVTSCTSVLSLQLSFDKKGTDLKPTLPTLSEFLVKLYRYLPCYLIFCNKTKPAENRDQW